MIRGAWLAMLAFGGPAVVLSQGLPGAGRVADASGFPPSQRPAILGHVVGTWEGEGELFGRPARFAMRWALELDGRFLGLSYTIRGDVRMRALAHYRVAEGDTLRGVWVDSRGEILDLEAVASDSTLETVWRSPTEEGRTVYRRIAADSLEVRDFVRAGSGWRPFGVARYGRR